MDQQPGEESSLHEGASRLIQFAVSMMERSHQINPQTAAKYFHTILSHAVGDLLKQVPGHSNLEKYGRVSKSLKKISSLYKTGLGEASSEHRSNWSKPENQCAYVYLYFTHHCYMVYMAMLPLLSPRFTHTTSRLEYRIKHHGQLRVCSIGGGPGSDVVGLSRFLEDSNLIPTSLHFTILDLFPQWADAWQEIHKHLSSNISVTYEKCDLVRDTVLPDRVLQRIREADIVTLEKSFSAVAAFMKETHQHRELLLNLFCELKLGCLVLFVDNRRREIVTVPFYDLFALPTGLQIANQWEGMPKILIKGYSKQVEEFKSMVHYDPMSSCMVTNLLLVKTRPGRIQTLAGVAGIRNEIYRRSLGDYGGSYDETAVLKRIWFEDLGSLRKTDNQMDLDDWECDSDLDIYFEYENFEKNFRDMMTEKKCQSWTRAMKTKRRQRKMTKKSARENFSSK